ncbi:hypothetical protein [Micromonospora sp. SL4-19]|uniref:hypothetical protein n=1 Tax=Micromonospora sp. SL4-19 TaxID=3399129 RepID=UPI003A4E5645
MVTRRLAAFLLRLAARRWPAELRGDLGREWAGELHVLAAEGRRARMLRYAASLAVSRPGTPQAERAPVDRRLRRTALPLLLAPLGGVASVVAGAVVMSLAYALLSGLVSWATAAQLPVWTALTATLAVLLAVGAGRWARRTALTGPLPVALGVVLPIGLVLVTVGLAGAVRPDELPAVAPGLLFWLAGLALVLWGAGQLAARGQVWAAWLLGALGALAVADLAVVLAVVGQIPNGAASVVDGVPQGDTISYVSAPLWLFACLTDSAFGLPRPTDWEIFLITDRVLIEPYLYLALTPYALAYAVRATRPADATPAGEAAPAPA